MIIARSKISNFLITIVITLLKFTFGLFRFPTVTTAVCLYVSKSVIDGHNKEQIGSESAESNKLIANGNLCSVVRSAIN